VDHVNRVEYGKLSGPEHVFGVLRSADFTMYVDTGMPIPKDKMRACAMLSPEETDLELTKVLDTSNFVNILRLKVGAVVMCTANVDLEAGICNGSQGVVVSAEGDAPIVRFHNGVQRAMVLHRIQSAEYPALVVSQVPLVLAWAISIHKCQGATMDIAEIDVGSTVFEFGQTYVALSRVKTLGGLYLSSLDVSRIRTNPVVRDFYARLAIASEARAAARAEEPAPEPKLDKGLCPLAEPELESESDVRAVSFSAFQFGGGGGACAVKKLE
jgi:ATP-dependent DNA helicase PIF1